MKFSFDISPFINLLKSLLIFVATVLMDLYFCLVKLLSYYSRAARLLNIILAINPNLAIRENCTVPFFCTHREEICYLSD